MEIIDSVKDWSPFLNLLIPAFLYMFRDLYKKVGNLDKEMAVNNNRDQEIKHEIESLISKIDLMADKVNDIARDLAYQKGLNKS